MSFEPHYVNTYAILFTVFIVFSMIFTSMIILFIENLKDDEDILNDPVVKLRYSRKRLKRNKSF